MVNTIYDINSLLHSVGTHIVSLAEGYARYASLYRAEDATNLYESTHSFIQCAVLLDYPTAKEHIPLILLKFLRKENFSNVSLGTTEEIANATPYEYPAGSLESRNTVFRFWQTTIAPRLADK